MEVLPYNLQDFKDLLLTSQCQISQHIFRGRVESMPQDCFGSKRGTNTKSGDRIFGSGVKLYVTDMPVLKPSVTVYQAASSDHLEEKRSLLCVASQMVPPVVQITWKRQEQDGSSLALTPGGTEQLDVIESDYTASILLIHQRDENSHTYDCSVTHEGGTVEQQIEEGVSQSPPKELPPDTLSTNQTLTERPSSEHPVSQKQVKLLCLVYTVLITKSLVYCCGVFLLRLVRRNCKHAAD
ncbi:immunoglobulin lambda-like polypeptide 1 [Oreochromis niloticus]|uniref:immunoglobulin lambda-like polypeptide 1 n=1 Tax=Oreochromis niloticus TaxID=8128 RepID=UPI000DF2EC8C|nr:immunoglobulin lambda-like polypeptide 1 [Oreochromis niloticus]